MNAIRLISISLLALLLGGCGPRMVELSQPPERLSQYGYSFMPPNEPGWKVAGRDGQRIMLGRIGNSTDETVIILAAHMHAPDFDSNRAFEAWIRKSARLGDGPSERYTPQQEELIMLRHAGADCGRIYVVSTDRQARKRSGKSGDMEIELMQLFCRHPDSRQTVTTLSYSQRAYPGFRDPQFGEKAERLLESLQFSDF